MKDLTDFAIRILELIDNRDDFTQSDLQGIVAAVVHDIYNIGDVDKAELLEACEVAKSIIDRARKSNRLLVAESIMRKLDRAINKAKAV